MLLITIKEKLKKVNGGGDRRIQVLSLFVSDSNVPLPAVYHRKRLRTIRWINEGNSEHYRKLRMRSWPSFSESEFGHLLHSAVNSGGSKHLVTFFSLNHRPDFSPSLLSFHFLICFQFSNILRNSDTFSGRPFSVSQNGTRFKFPQPKAFFWS